jgi:hypothetical protein
VVEHGAHEALLERRGLYARLIAHQVSGAVATRTRASVGV